MSGPANEHPVDLDALLEHEATSSLREALAATAEVVAEIQDREATQDLDPGLVAALVAALAEEDAPFTVDSIARRISAGTLTWADFWSAPLDQPGGAWVMARASRLQLARARILLAERRTLTGSDASCS